MKQRNIITLFSFPVSWDSYIWKSSKFLRGKKAVTKKKINLFLNVSQLIVHIELPSWFTLMIRKLSPWRHSFDERYSFIVLSRLKCFLFTCICPHKRVATRERFHFTLSFWCKYYSCITEIIFLPKQSTLCRPHSQDEWCNYRFDAFSRHHCLVLHL